MRLLQLFILLSLVLTISMAESLVCATSTYTWADNENTLHDNHWFYGPYDNEDLYYFGGYNPWNNQDQNYQKDDAMTWYNKGLAFP